ncbi:MAG: putative toxin-antitoxin system toxin component, PIN family [Nitrospiraceae bacterium]|nr:putative toxin-antitoxin system toxin component, PIN family [Nitrospiraceae bacterium]
MRVVFDTNIYVSAFAIPGGQAEDAYLGAIHDRFELFTSVPILTETATVLQNKFEWSEEKARTLVQAISHVATVVAGGTRLRVVRDEPDNRILECAVKAQADFIVTGDRQLLALMQYERVKILRLADFLRLLAAQKEMTD